MHINGLLHYSGGIAETDIVDPLMALLAVTKANAEYEPDLQSSNMRVVCFEAPSSLPQFTSKKVTALEPHGSLGSQDIFWDINISLISLCP